MQLDNARLQALAAMPLAFLRQQYPNHIMHLMNADTDALTPRQLHPVFYGCYDWHSAVHGYWLLLRCLHLAPDLPCREAVIDLFNGHFTAENIAIELAYFTAPGREAFERPYGYGWLLALDQALAQSALPPARHWHACLRPLSQHLADRFISYLDKLGYPIRVGTHANTAFALLLALDHARALQHAPLQQAIEQAARRFYLADTRYPAHYEPAGDDYLSGALIEALLMARLLAADFTAWFDQFLPDVASLTPLLTPATLSDRTDPKITHLDGLNLSRAWCMRQLVRQLPAAHPASQPLCEAAERHLQASAPQVTTSHYNGGHWLATFALLAHLA